MILFKYKSIESSIDKTFSNTFLRDCKALLNNELWFSSLDKLNDPYEGVFKINENDIKAIKIFNKKADLNELKNAKNNLVQILKQNSGILSMTTDNQNLLMWSHYTNNQKGYSLQYEIDTDDFIRFDGKFFNPKLMYLRKVTYSDNFPTISAIENDHRKFVTYKGKCWVYEKEYRFISPLAGLYTYKQECLKAIFLGATCDFQNEMLLCSLAYIKGIKVYKANFFKDKFKMFFLPYDLESLNRKIDCKVFIERSLNK